MAYLLTVKGLEELIEVSTGIVRAGSRLWMVLDGQHGKLSMPNTFYGAIIEVDMCHLK